MKLLVDKMPKKPKDCLFCQAHQAFPDCEVNYLCNLGPLCPDIWKAPSNCSLLRTGCPFLAQGLDSGDIKTL